MKYLTLGLCLLISSSLHAQEEKFPFFFFKMLPYSLENPKNAKDASVDLCKIVTKDCKLPDLAEIKVIDSICIGLNKCYRDDFLKYLVEPLYESSSKASKVTGAIVNAIYNRCPYSLSGYSHCQTSAALSFIVNLKGERKNFNHYSVADEDYMKGDFSHRHTESLDNGFSDYLRIMDAVPSKSSEEMTDHWYAFANPDESGGKLWFNHKSNLLTPKYLVLYYLRDLFLDVTESASKELVTVGGGLYNLLLFYDFQDEITSFTTNELTRNIYYHFYDVEYKDPSLRGKNYQKDNPPPAIKFEGIPVQKIDLSRFYKNGFFEKGVWINEPDFPNTFLMQEYIEKSRKAYEASKKGKSIK